MASCRHQWHTHLANRSNTKTVLGKVCSKRRVMRLWCNRAPMTTPCPWLRTSTASSKTWHATPSMSVMIRDKRATCSRIWTQIRCTNSSSNNSRRKPSSNAALLTATTTSQVPETAVVTQTEAVATLALAKSSASFGTVQVANNRTILLPQTVNSCTKVALRSRVPFHVKLMRT